ncbi:hypothetical protein NMY22_g3941 [Coprinellus aureogranulatus]|nr:hypothetical protein NMY22_g3941 [Coprinellus aureogranulatus]
MGYPLALSASPSPPNAYERERPAYGRKTSEGKELTDLEELTLSVNTNLTTPTNSSSSYPPTRVSWTSSLSIPSIITGTKHLEWKTTWRA